MRQLYAFSLLVLITCAMLAFSQESFAQAAGTKPELIMYRHNGSSGTSPLPVNPLDVLGTLKWNGLTGINGILTGASIQSSVDQVAPGFLMANMLFRTSGAAGLKDRMIITSSGLVGIGTINPLYHLDVVGNTHTSGRFYGRIHFDFGEPTGLPSTYTDEAYFERKNRASLGLVANPYVDGGILSLAPGGNSLDRQLFVGGNDGIWTRSQTLSGANTWDPWYRLMTSEDIEGHVGRIPRFTGATIGDLSSALHDSQLFDNGTNVAIGGTHPPTPPVFDLDYRLTVNGLATGAAHFIGDTRMEGNMGIGTVPSATNRLDVLGNSHLDGNANVTGNLDVDTDVNVDGNLQLDGNGRIDGNVGIGKAPTGFDLDVHGESNFDGRVKIGATFFPTATNFELAVGGGIIAEEVLVRMQPWPDYVFEKDYTLTPLKEVEKYVGEHKHLPGVASAKDVEETGLDLGAMQKAQMEKIEELYLHLIQQQKLLEQQQKTIERLESEINNLKK